VIFLNKLKTVVSILIIVFTVLWIAFEMQLFNFDLPFMQLIFGLIGLKFLMDSLNESDLD
jgi:hypothetical protein